MIAQQVVIYYSRQKMNQNEITELQRNLSRCIQRLPDVGRQSSVDQLLPAFCFTATTLEKYLQKEHNQTKAKHYFELFEADFSKYRLRIAQTPASKEKFQKGNKQEILNGIANTLANHSHLKSQAGEAERLRETVQRREEEEFLQSQLKKIRKFYEEHNIDDTYKEVEALRTKANQSEYLKQALTLEMQEEFKAYEQQYQKMLQLYSNFDANDGWTDHGQEQNLHIQYKIYQEEKLVALRVTAEIDVQMLPFMAIACEIDLQKHYMPFVGISQQIKNQKKKTPRNVKIGYNLTSVPFLADRQCHFYATGYDRIKTTGSIFIFTQSIEDNQHIKNKYGYVIEDAENKVFLKVHFFCLDYKPISKHKAYARFVSKADFQLSFLPMFILTTSAKYFGINYFNSIVGHAKKYKGSKWQQRVSKNPTMYSFFQQKIDQYFGKD